MDFVSTSATVFADGTVNSYFEGSPVCFIMASFNYPGAIKSSWGRMADEMDEQTWHLLNSPGEGLGDLGLGLLLRMTRLEDLGLGQLCLPDLDLDSESDSDAQIDHMLSSQAMRLSVSGHL